MFNKTQKMAIGILKGRMAQFLSEYEEYLTLPELKFLKDMTLGIIKSGSVILLRIAKELEENITLKKTCERFTTHLSKAHLEGKLMNALLDNQCREINDDTGIIADESDIVKNYAKKMEGLSKVRDGSTGDCSKLGYNLLNIIGFNNYDIGYQILPLYSELISSFIELKNIPQRLKDLTYEIAKRSSKKGTYLFDRGFDSRSFIEHLCREGLNFIIRSTARRDLIVDNEEQNFLKVTQTVKLKQKYLIEGQEIKCGIKQVEIRTDPHPKKNPNKAKVWLVVAKFCEHKNDKSGLFYFFCNYPGQQNLSKEEMMEKTVRMYRNRWKIEEVHRHVKQEYGWEKMQLASYQRLRNMNLVLFITMSYLYSLKKYVHTIVNAFPNRFMYRNQGWEEIYAFVYYKLSNLLMKCFSSFKRRRRTKYKDKYAESVQLVLRF